MASDPLILVLSRAYPMMSGLRFFPGGTLVRLVVKGEGTQSSL